MTKVEAPTLEKAYELAAAELSCSVTELQYEVIQYPSKGVLGLFKKQAIIVATRANIPAAQEDTPKRAQSIEEAVAEEIVITLQEEEVQPAPIEEEKDVNLSSDSVVEGFFESDNKTEEPYVDRELSQSIEESLQHLFEVSCFDIDVVEVDVVDNTALIFIDGEDAALLIGKEGYRYNALSYMLFNWLHSKYQLYIKLEIAEFLTSQQEMIRNYIQPVIENVEKYGKAKTRFLDGILVQIALEQLREAFPNKYVAIKTGKSGKKFVVINDFHTKPHA
ncbi:MAG TPA: protein jag [Epsilonproteobacteria bacterium]|nr:protein jag [Campylobacterota bacterium]